MYLADHHICARLSEGVLDGPNTLPACLYDYSHLDVTIIVYGLATLNSLM